MPAPPARSPRAAAGFALPLAIVVALVLGGMLYALNRVVSGYRHRSTRFRDGEAAYYMALGALRAGEAALEGLADRAPPAGGWRRELFDLLVRSRPADLDRGDEALDLPFVTDLVPAGLDAEVAVVVRFPRVAPYLPAPPPGFLPAPEEKRGVLEVEGFARVRGATRRVMVRRRFATLSAAPPVIGRFCLAFGGLTGDSEAANAVTYSPRLGTFHESVSRRLAWPLTAYPLPPPGAGDPVAPPATRFGDAPLRPATEGGWIGLFGETPWVLNAAFGAGDRSPLEEGHTLRNFAATYRDPAGGDLYLRTRNVGFARDILSLPIFEGVERDAIPDMVSLLQVSGDARAPTPALVLGRAFRRYLRVTKVAREEPGPFAGLPGVAAARFDEARADFEALAPGGGYPRYRALMARSVLEPLNRAYDYVVTSDERRDEAGRVRPGGTPFVPARVLADGPAILAARDGTAAFLYPDPGLVTQARAGGAVTLRDTRGDRLFTGSPEDLLPGLAAAVEARVTRRYPAAPGGEAAGEFRARHRDGRELRLGGVVLVEGDLRVAAAHVTRGGTLACTGRLEVAGPLTTAPGVTVSLVALGGDLEVLNERPVAAALLAPRGEVRPSPRGLDVRGQVVAATFDPLTWLGVTGAQRVVYDPRLDPAVPARRAAGHVFSLGDDREVRVTRR